MIVSDGKTVDPVVRARHPLDPYDPIRNHRGADGCRQRIPDTEFDGSKTPDPVLLEDEHRVVVRDRERPPLPRLDPDERLGCPVDRDRRNPPDARTPILVDGLRGEGSNGVRPEGACVVEIGPGEVELLDDKVPDRNSSPGTLIVPDLDLGLAKEAVAPFCCVEERVGIPNVRPGEPEEAA